MRIFEVQGIVEHTVASSRASSWPRTREVRPSALSARAEQAAGELLVALKGEVGLTIGRDPRLLGTLGRAVPSRDATGCPTTSSGPSTRPPESLPLAETAMDVASRELLPG
jgi:hypothetical protein